MMYQHLPHIRGDEPEIVDLLIEKDFIYPTYVGMNQLLGVGLLLSIYIYPTYVGMNQQRS